jgi:hypothetical protein
VLFPKYYEGDDMEGGIDEVCSIQNFSQKTQREENTWNSETLMGGKIKMDLKEIGHGLDSSVSG